MGFSLLCCCACNKNEIKADAEDINENSRLIPAAEEPLPPTTTFDYGKFEQRLGTIVRAMEGRMVNVNHPGPFDLQSGENVAGEGQDEPNHPETAARDASRSSSRARMIARLVNAEEESSTHTSAKAIHNAPLPHSHSKLNFVGSLSQSWGD